MISGGMCKTREKSRGTLLAGTAGPVASRAEGRERLAGVVPTAANTGAACPECRVWPGIRSTRGSGSTDTGEVTRVGITFAADRRDGGPGGILPKGAPEYGA